MPTRTVNIALSSQEDMLLAMALMSLGNTPGASEGLQDQLAELADKLGVVEVIAGLNQQIAGNGDGE